MIESSNSITVFVGGFFAGSVVVMGFIYRSFIQRFFWSLLPGVRDSEEEWNTELEGDYSDEMEDMDIEMLRHLHEDTRRIFDEILQTFSDLSNKAIQLAQVNGVVIAILVAVADQARLESYLNPLTLFGAILFLLSASISVYAYRIEEFEIGINAADIQYAIDQDLSEHFYHLWLLQDLYPELLVAAETKVNRKAKWVSWAIYVFLAGLITIFTGIFLSLYP